jgi:hypothetical protein
VECTEKRYFRTRIERVTDFGKESRVSYKNNEIQMRIGKKFRKPEVPEPAILSLTTVLSPCIRG